ncbi:MAG: hypothetical protein ACI85K_003689 [Hyphomicrobiaceae bacterium]|jgi:hypothetical protein
MVVCLSAIVVAQDEVPGVVRAERLVKQLELPDKCPDAMYALWQLGADAVPALSRAVRDPRIEVLESACAVIHEMKDVAAPMRTHLERELKQADGRRKKALEWALRAVTSQTIAVAGWTGEIVLLDRSGKVQEHHKGFKQLWGVQLLPSGGFLVAQGADGAVVNVDAGGDVIKQLDGQQDEVSFGPGLRAQRLLNGHTVIVSSRKNVRELDACGKLVWKYKAVATVATRLLNGHTLIVSNRQNQLLEVNRDGKVARSFKIPPLTFGARRLPNGHTLLTTRSSHCLIELDADGKQVKTNKTLNDPNDVLRYADGTTIIASQKGVTAYGADGETLWTHKMEWAGGLAR